MTNEIAKSQPTTAAIAPVANMSEFLALAGEFEKSGMFGCSQPGQGAVLLSTCLADRISPIEFIRTYHLIDGRPAMRADAMLAKFVAQGGRYKILAFSPEKAEGSFSYGENEITYGMTFAEATAAGLTHNGAGKIKANWKNFPRQMLWARVVSAAIRLVCPGIVAGVYTPEEVADFNNSPQAVEQPECMVIDPSEVTIPGAPAEKPAQPEPAAKPGPAVIDGDAMICPCGKIKGTPWVGVETEILKMILSSQHPAVLESMTTGHYIALRAELDTRGDK